MSLAVAPLSPGSLADLVAGAPAEAPRVGSAVRDGLRAALVATGVGPHRRLGAVDVERGGSEPRPFAWDARLARRSLASAAVSRLVTGSSATLREAVNDAAAALVARAQSGRAGAGSLGAWLEGAEGPARALARAGALTWASTQLEVAGQLPGEAHHYPADAYYDVATARVTLRARRDLRAGGSVVRLRAGSPSRTAGAGLRADLAALALADPAGVAPARLVGVWPEAGVVIGLDADDDALLAGARSFARCARVRAALAA